MNRPASNSPLHLDAMLARVSKPSRYSGGEWNSVRKDWQAADLHIALAFPDVYELGMAHLGLQILYELINARPDSVAERTFAPWVDMEGELRASEVPLFSLESRSSIAAFDLLGFTLPYELTYSNVLRMLDLAGLPVMSADRDDGDTLVIAGGSCCFNPEPLTDFIDLFVIGDGEAVIHELLDALRDSGWRPSAGGGRARRQREAFLRHAAKIPGVYVPSLYEVDPTGAARPKHDVVPRRVVKSFIPSLPFAPVRPVVPYLQPVHDRAAIEIMRGCARGCRFCQAGMVYRSVRERPIDETLAMVDQLLANTGYEELGLVSLSSADHSRIEELVHELGRRHPNVNISLPSLRVDSFSVGLAKAIHRRKTGFTFAPEAGSQRLRDVINKHVTEDDILGAAEAAFGNGWSLIKLYFMIGLPGEDMEDVAGIVRLGRQITAIGRVHHGNRAQVNVSVNSFSPKPQTPFQWMSQDAEPVLREKQELLRRGLRGGKLNWSDNRVSFLETTLARGDRRVGQAIYAAFLKGARFDAWSEHFRFDLWQEAFAETGCEMSQYTYRARSLDEALPWDHIDGGVSKTFLKAELLRSSSGVFTPDCHVHDRCSACGVFKLDQKCKEAVSSAAVASNI